MIWAGIALLVLELLLYGACISALPRRPAAWAWILIVPGLVVGIAGLVQNSRRKPAALFAALVAVSLGWGLFFWATPRAAHLAERLGTLGVHGARPEVLIKSAAMLVVLLTLLMVVGGVWLALASARGNSGKEPPSASQLPWEIYYRKRFSHDPYKDLDTVLCIDKETGRPVILYGKDRFLNTLVLGPIGTGKTSRVFMPLIYQDLMKKAQSVKMGITIIEPNGALVEQVAQLCFLLGIPYAVLDPYDPASARFNPMLGPVDIAAETMRSVLRSIFGKQEPFFALVQEIAAKNVILLLRELKGEELDIVEALRALRDPETLSNYVSQLEQLKGKNDELAQYFRRELLGVLRDKYYQFAAGLRQQLEDLASNEKLRAILTGGSGIDLDRHLEEGGVLLVNTRMGPLGRLGDIFGKFVLMHFQNAVFRRPGNEFTRTPHFLYIDELPRYMNPDMERFFAIGRQYRCGLVVAMQSLTQMEMAAEKGFDDIVLGMCRNRVIYGGLSHSDALKLQKQFGELLTSRWDEAYDTSLGMPQLLPEHLRRSDTYEPMWRATDIIYLDAYTFVYQIVREGQVMKPGWGYNELVDISKVRRPKQRKAQVAGQPLWIPAPPGARTPEDHPNEQTLTAPQPLVQEKTPPTPTPSPALPVVEPLSSDPKPEENNPAAPVEDTTEPRPAPTSQEIPEGFVQADDSFWTFQ
ncbi:TraM recognition domain-containing protein [Moorellaceae bacterium AZ2]